LETYASSGCPDLNFSFPQSLAEGADAVAIAQHVPVLTYMGASCWFSNDFLIYLLDTLHNIILHFMAFESVWRHAKYLWHSFAYNSESFPKSFKIEKWEVRTIL
jgi:hypothetical protein